MQKLSKKQITAAALKVIAAVIVLWTIWENLTVGVTEYTITSQQLPEEFDGFTIAQVSDLHNSHLSEQVLEILWAESPDLIAVTGDVVDSNHTDLDAVKEFFLEAVQIAPCYFITGNHEAWITAEAYAQLEECGMEFLHDEKLMLERNGAEIALLGVDDPAFLSDAPTAGNVTSLVTPKELQTLAGDARFTLLLSHRPELFANYAEAGMDVVLSGHAHGGQFRLPFIGGIAAPDQGIFPKYDAGVYTSGQTAMIVSRGIGNSMIPIRFNNRPEVVMITLSIKPFQ